MARLDSTEIADAIAAARRYSIDSLPEASSESGELVVAGILRMTTDVAQKFADTLAEKSSDHATTEPDGNGGTFTRPATFNRAEFMHRACGS